MRNEDAGGGAQDLATAFRDLGLAARVKQVSPVTYDAATTFWRAAYSGSALSPRMKELVLVALHATVTSLNSEAVRRHVSRAIVAGATEEEVLDVLITIVGAANHALYFALPVLMRELAAAGHPDAGLPPVTADAQAVKEDFIRVRGLWNEQRDIIVRLMPEYFAGLAQLTMKPWENGALTGKERELICIAIDCTVTHMFEPGLAIHIRQALRNGASRQEILEVFQLAAVTGLEGYLLGAAALYPPAVG